MKKLYLLFAFIFVIFSVHAQDCSLLQLTYSVTESRCVATGSIDINGTGGSGDYNYRVTGALSTPFTSSNVITGLVPGYYSIIISDVTTGCTRKVDSAYVPGSYADPRFQLVKTDATCAGNDGTISANNQQFGRAPYTYTIIAPSPSSVGSSSTTGQFTGLISGEYSIQLRDSCGGIQVRKVTIESYSWWFDSISIEKTDCNNANLFIRLNDNKGNTNTTGTAFNGFTYGIVMMPKDTIWNSSNSFNFLLGKKRNVTIVVKDNCGNIHSSPWTLPNDTRPNIGNVELSYFTCTNFKASLSSKQNLTSAEYCLYDSLGVLMECNSTGIFPNLSYGSYCIKVADVCYDTVISRCFASYAPIPAVASEVTISDRNCSGFTAAITGQTNLINPTYCLLNSNNQTLSCNNTGAFPNLSYNNYCIQINNGCSDTTITRCFTAEPPIPVISGYTSSASNCTSFNLTAYGTNLFNPLYCLYDTSGNVIACDSSGTFTNIEHGRYCITAISCGDTSVAFCFTSSRPLPTVAGYIPVSNITCTGFTATVTGQANLINPQYCLYTATDSLLTCNTTGVFADIAYGSYCIKIKDSCTDSTIVRCFTELRSVRTVNSNVQQTNASCTGFTATITGYNFFNPQFCVYDAQDTLVQCNTNGVFDNLPYGSYCFTMHDACIDTTVRVCKTFTSVKGIYVTSDKSCSLGNADISIQFIAGNAPYRIKIFNPNGLIRYDTISVTNPFHIQLPVLPTGAQYKIVGIDACNQKDTAFITPTASLVTKSIDVKSKCPSASYQNGAGDLIVTCSSNFYAVQPRIIKKGTSNFHRNHSSVSGDVYTFSDLEPATYIVEYKMQSCNSKLYDTVTISPYRFPSQGQSAIYECDNSALSLSGDVDGGVAPFTFEIIGSIPAAPSVTTPPQNSAVFSINNGTHYSLIRFRAIDACGNATLNDVSVLPLQNISVKASQLCFFQDVNLTVDTIPNATYEWYRKTSPVDSVLVDNGLSHNLPFFVPEEIGVYVCKVNVNDGCLTRLSSFNLDGQCDYTVLPVSVQLKGKKLNGTNALYWTINEEKTISSYILERKAGKDNNYKPITTVAVQSLSGGNNYSFNDLNAAGGTNWYRLRLKYKNGQSTYSNSISFFNNSFTKVYPNPAKDQLNISLSSEKPADFTIGLLDITGRSIYSNELKAIVNTTLVIGREKNVLKGIYLLKVTNHTGSSVETYKILME